jgi:hypothetical protein
VEARILALADHAEALISAEDSLAAGGAWRPPEATLRRRSRSALVQELVALPP